MRLRNSKDALDNSCHVDMEEYDDVARNNKQQEENHYEVELDNVYCYAEADEPKEKVPYFDLGKRDDYNHYEEINTVAAGKEPSGIFKQSRNIFYHSVVSSRRSETG